LESGSPLLLACRKENVSYFPACGCDVVLDSSKNERCGRKNVDMLLCPHAFSTR